MQVCSHDDQKVSKGLRLFLGPHGTLRFTTSVARIFSQRLQRRRPGPGRRRGPVPVAAVRSLRRFIGTEKVWRWDEIGDVWWCMEVPFCELVEAVFFMFCDCVIFTWMDLNLSMFVIFNSFPWYLSACYIYNQISAHRAICSSKLRKVQGCDCGQLNLVSSEWRWKEWYFRDRLPCYAPRKRPSKLWSATDGKMVPCLTWVNEWGGKNLERHNA